MKLQPIRSNLHTHTCFCDGTHSPEEMILAAIEQGMDTLGFSGHSYTPFDAGYTMSPEATEQYFREISRLKEQYADKIRILAGIEQDLYAPKTERELDFSIGSVHYLHLNGEYVSVDDTYQIAENAVKEHCSGDWYRFTKSYFETVATVAECTACDIVGHFDLVSKFNERFPRFEESDPRYLHPALEALDALLGQDAVLEVNTGAMARGYRRLPYPAPIFLHRIAEKRGNVMLSSDAHDKDALLFGFSDATRILRSCGITKVLVARGDEWDEVGI